MKFNSDYDTLILVEVLFKSTTLRYEITKYMEWYLLCIIFRIFLIEINKLKKPISLWKWDKNFFRHVS